MRKLIKKFSLLVLFSLLIMLISVTPAICAGSGDGTGGGGGASVPLLMDWCYPANGETNVSTTVVIQCKYSHNVAQGNVSERNVKQFSLTKKSDGTKVDIEVYTADAQLEFDKRQYIYIRPISPLENNTTYVLFAKAGIQAKNGMVTAVDQKFEFTTCSAYGNFNDSSVESMITKEEAAVLGETITSSKSNENTEINNTSDGDDQNTVNTSGSNTDSQKVEVTEEEHERSDTEKDSLLLFLLVVVILLALSVVIKFIWLKKAEKNN